MAERGIAGGRVKLKEADTPTAQITKAAAQPVTVTDDDGRAIVLRRPGVLAQFHLIEALGDTARNSVYVNMVAPLLFVTSSKGEVESLIKRLDETGIAAVMAGVQNHFGVSSEDDAKNG